MRLITDVAALYTDPRGPYPQLLAEVYDEKRDARRYAGPWPVVAHPPCGPWGTLHHLYKGSEGDYTLAILAVDAVRRWGGVLEHPRGSGLWSYCGLPKPGEPADKFGGYSISVEQVDWGHACRKPTWLYIVGGVPGPMPAKGTPTHQIRGSLNNRMFGHNPNWKGASKKMRRLTPPDFARWLIDIARSAGRA